MKPRISTSATPMPMPAAAPAEMPWLPDDAAVVVAADELEEVFVGEELGDV
jgi:hypothetical protein